MKRVSIFWTGGYDSSFRVCQLSRLNIEIQPYYLSDNRRSEKNELNAIREITEFLNALDETKATILPLEYVPKPDRDKDYNITKSYKTLRKQDFMGSNMSGSQYLQKIIKVLNCQSIRMIKLFNLYQNMVP